MPRSISSVDRAIKIRESSAALPALIEAAETYSAQYGYADPRSLSAWEDVENHGATIHRQSRLLAGKNRGG